MKKKILSMIAALVITSLLSAETSMQISVQNSGEGEVVEDTLFDGQRSSDNPLRRQMLYAPFRESYFKGSCSKEKSAVRKKCVFCADIEANNDEQRLLLTRFEHNVVFLNLFPYARGQVLIMPTAHVADLESLSAEARQELIAIIVAVPRIFQEIFGALGTNIGINVGKVAGASKPDHIHIHALPRFESDHKSFIQLLGETHVVQWDLNALYQELKPAFDELKRELGGDILEYYESGQHEQEMRDALNKAWQELEQIPVTENATIVIDIDETALSSYEYFKANNWQKGSEELFNAWKMLKRAKAFAPTQEFYQKAIEKGFKIVFISCRGVQQYQQAYENLCEQGYTIFEEIILRSPEEQAQLFSSEAFSSYKAHRRQQLVDEGYDIVACVGDQWSDLEGGNTGLKIKVPTCFK
ncbi:HAD family acid phosphatase [Candidatus Dependentiae bacterium]